VLGTDHWVKDFPSRQYYSRPIRERCIASHEARGAACVRLSRFSTKAYSFVARVGTIKKTHVPIILACP